MDVPLFTAVYFVVTLLLVVTTWRRGRSSKAIWPKGPAGWPLVGHLFHFDENALKTLRQYHKKYGKTIKLTMGAHDVIICGDGELVKKYFIRETFNCRPDHSFMNTFAPIGIIHYNHELFRSVKRFTVKALKSIGFGGREIEPLINREVEAFVDAIDKKRAKGPLTITLLTGPAASNVVSSLVVGQRFEFEDEIRKQLDSLFLRAIDGDVGVNYLGVLNFVESVKYLAYFPIKAIKRSLSFQGYIRRYIESRVEAVRSKFNSETDEPTNYIECFYKELHECKDDKDFTHEYHSEEVLIQNCNAFFIAGSATTQEYLEWWFLLMGQYPEVQDKMFKEIARVIGKEKATLAHKNEMPYTEAVLAEVHRFSSLVSLNLPHCVDKDTEFGDYFLPAGTQIIVNLYEIHRDPDNFDEPDVFKPERFLTPDGRYSRLDKVFPFGYGKRSCPGESLAQAEIFLFTVATLQRFIIKLPAKWDGETSVRTFSRLPVKTVDIIAEDRKWVDV